MTRAAANRQQDALNRTMAAIQAETKRKASINQPGLVDHSRNGEALAVPRITLPANIAELVYDLAPQRRLKDLVLANQVMGEVEEFLDERANTDLLRANSLEPRHTVLLIGPPGNGKTTLAGALATELELPFLYLRYDAIVDSYLGETASRLRRLIDFATANPCLLFFDEFEAIGKERGDPQETGEIKRVVSTLLVQLDRLPSHTVVVCATNHPEMLDRAAWRRFEIQLKIDSPTRDQILVWFDRFEKSLNGKSTGIEPAAFADAMVGRSISRIEDFTLDSRRKSVLSKGGLTTGDALRILLERVAREGVVDQSG